jgi:hypothetical protein
MSGLLRLAGALLLLAPISCVTVFAEDFSQEGEHWRIWVEEVRTGWWGYSTGHADPGSDLCERYVFEEAVGNTDSRNRSCARFWQSPLSHHLADA